MQGRVNPGNVSVRLGKTLELYELAVSESKIVTAANLIDVMADYISVYGDFDLVTYEALPGFAYDDGRRVEEIFADLRARIRYVLGVAKKNNVFAWHTPSVGDGSALDVAGEKGEL